MFREGRSLSRKEFGVFERMLYNTQIDVGAIYSMSEGRGGDVNAVLDEVFKEGSASGLLDFVTSGGLNDDEYVSSRIEKIAQSSKAGEEAANNMGDILDEVLRSEFKTADYSFRTEIDEVHVHIDWEKLHREHPDESKKTLEYLEELEGFQKKYDQLKTELRVNVRGGVKALVESYMIWVFQQRGGGLRDRLKNWLRRHRITWGACSHIVEQLESEDYMRSYVTEEEDSPGIKISPRPEHEAQEVLTWLRGKVEYEPEAAEESQPAAQEPEKLTSPEPGTAEKQGETQASEEQKEPKKQI